MPTYVYRCDACAHQFDIVQRMTEDSLQVCPACRAPRLVRQVQAAGFALKGTGWYVTDFRDKGKKDKATEGDAKSAESPGEAKPEVKTDAKADPKTDPKTETKADTKTETKPDPKTQTKTDTKGDSAKPAATGTGD